MDLSVEIINATEGAIGKMVPLQISPTALDIVEFWCVLGQPLDAQPWSLGKGLCRQLAGMNWAVVEHEHDWNLTIAGTWSALLVEFFQQANKVRAALGRTGEHGQLLAIGFKQAEHGPLTALPWRFDAQVRPTLSPGMGQIWMREGF